MIRTEKLTKQYGSAKALIDLDLHIEEGDVFGFIGPNGAGKSTTMMILSGLLAPTKGRAFIDGHDVLRYPREIRRLIGYMPDFFGVYDNLKTTEYLSFYAAAYDIPKQRQSALIDDVLELVNLGNKRDAYVDTLSRGMKQRLGLARCLIHNPQVLILDEPASGLDPRARIEMKEILKELKRMHKTIMISSHILPELAEVCDQIGVIEKGRLTACGNVRNIVSRASDRHFFRLHVLSGQESAQKKLASHPLVHHLQLEDGYVRFSFIGDEEEQAELLHMLIGEGIRVYSFSPEQSNLEDVFLSITEGVGS